MPRRPGGRRWLVDVPMAGVAASLAGPTLGRTRTVPATGPLPTSPRPGRVATAPWPGDRRAHGRSGRQPRRHAVTDRTLPPMTELLLREVIVEGRTVDVRARDDRLRRPAPRAAPRRGRHRRAPRWSPGCTTTTSICWPWPPPSSPFRGPGGHTRRRRPRRRARRRRPSLAPGAWLRPSATTSRSPGRSTAGDWTRSSAIGPYGCSTARASSGSSTPGRRADRPRCGRPERRGRLDRRHPGRHRPRRGRRA